MGFDNCGDYELDLLRSWRLRRDAADIYVANRQQRLIAALAVRGPAIRSCLAGLLWPGNPESRALESLRVSVHLISRQAPGLIVSEGASLSLTGRIDVDLHRVKARTRMLNEDCSNVTASIFAELRDAELLPGWYEDWVLFEQDRLRQDRLRAFTAMSKQLLEQGEFEVAGAAAEAALEIEPLYETAVRFLFTAELQRGNPAAAVRCYERYRMRLEKNMGLQPSESFKGLIEHAVQRQFGVEQGG
jgi:DNA-binding SARP family transcriptional activator